MTKQIKNVYEKLYSYENLYLAYINARKNKRFRDEVLDFTYNVEERLSDLSLELKMQTYQIGKYREFYVYEPKKRLIMALPFKDRVVQWAIYQLINPCFDKSYINDSFGCRIGKGTHRAVARLHYWLKLVGKKDEKHYFLKLDIAKYFYRVDHDILISLLHKKIKDKQLLSLLERIIKYDEVAFGLEVFGKVDSSEDRLKGRGMPIGNLTSQMFANLYLNELDQYCKRVLGIKYYIRYMDDVIILSNDKEKLHEYKRLIESFIEDKLNLNLNNKTAIRPISLGVEFVGYRLWPTHIKLKKKTALKMRRRIKYVIKKYQGKEMTFDKMNNTIQSYMGIMKHCNSYKLQEKLFETNISKITNTDIL